MFSSPFQKFFLQLAVNAEAIINAKFYFRRATIKSSPSRLLTFQLLLLFPIVSILKRDSLTIPLHIRLELEYSSV